jgi:UDP-4-amino-4-deoxy-L-arabinose-oxoglutarate aminotransferase
MAESSADVPLLAVRQAVCHVTRTIEFYKHDLGEAELLSVRNTLGSLFLALGPRVVEFEKAFGAYLGAEHVVGVSSCTMALLLALRAFDVGPGDEVITTPITFVASSNAILHAGAGVVFADIDPRTGLLDPAAVEAAITPRTKAILAVHLYGQLADMPALRRIADRHRIVLIEDAAHAIEARRDGVRPGVLGDAAAFSFYATKSMTSGDGGALVIRDAAVAARVRHLRNHGMTKDASSRYGKLYAHWDMVELGYKATLTDIEAALLLPQIGRLDARRARRQAIVERYEALLRAYPHVSLAARTGTSAHHLFAVLVPLGTRDAVLAGLGRRGIGCAVNYRSIHTLTYYRERFGLLREAFPHAADFGDRTVSLPLWPDLPLEDADLAVAGLKAAIADALALPAGAPEASEARV